MALLEHTTMLSTFFILVSFVIFIYRYQNQRTIIPTNWPVLGMIPGFIVNSHRVHNYITEILMHTGGTFMWKGLWFFNMDILVTTDPLDIQHVLSKNFNNYPKGDEFRKIFDMLGDGIFTSDGELWKIHRKVTMSLLKHAKFQSFLETIIWNKLESGLLPILDSISKQGNEVDFQEIFNRLTFDTTCKVLLDYDPESLSLDFPYFPCLKEFHETQEAILLRHVTPPSLWKFQEFLRVGSTIKKWGDGRKKWSDGRNSVEDFFFTHLSLKQNQYNSMNCEHEQKEFLLFPLLMREIKDRFVNFGDPTKLLRDTLSNLMSAGKDTISSALCWFFYNLAKNPTVEDKIMEELRTHLGAKMCKGWQAKELGEMVYFHGAILESLRLFPPVPFNHKSPLQSDILPSCHRLNQNTKIVLSFYSMGRMKSIWGEDCMEFKPERWISKEGGIKHEPSYKFTTFNAGPRTCVGKDMSISQLKIVLATILYRYHIELVEGHHVLPADSMVLQIKHGLRVRLTKRTTVN